MPEIASYFKTQPERAEELYLLASEIVDDFEDYGPVIQGNVDGAYDETTVISRLRKLRNAIIEELRRSSEG